MKTIVIQRNQEMKEPSPEQASGWLGQPTGEYYQYMLAEKIEEIKDNWANGLYTGESTEETAQLNAEAVGKIQGIGEAIVLLEEMTEVDDETED
jgi:hypothetical protein